VHNQGHHAFSKNGAVGSDIYQKSPKIRAKAGVNTPSIAPNRQGRHYNKDIDLAVSYPNNRPIKGGLKPAMIYLYV